MEKKVTDFFFNPWLDSFCYKHVTDRMIHNASDDFLSDSFFKSAVCSPKMRADSVIFCLALLSGNKENN